MLKLVIIAILSLSLVACEHHNDVRPGIDGVNTVIVQSSTRKDGSRDAISQAKHFCKQYARQAVFISEKQDYVGGISEAAYNILRKTSQAATIAGSSAAVFGDRQEARIGRIAATGGFAGEAVLTDGYQAEMSFKCI